MMTTKEELRQAVEDFIADLQIYEQVDMWNEYCEKNNYYDDRIYPIHIINDLLSDRTPLEILSYATDGFNANDEYFVETIYGFKSSDFADELVDLDELIDYIITEGDNFKNENLKDIFADYKNPDANADYEYDSWRNGDYD